jgi:superoxide dismutase, Cu-Zn family
MKLRVFAVIFGLTLWSGLTLFAQTSQSDKSTHSKKRTAVKKVVSMKDSKGQDVGTVTLVPAAHGVTLKLNLKNLAPGEHAMHFHQVAKCEAPGFTSAGPHFNPSGKHHGLENPQGAHEGDMPNITVKRNGTSTQTIHNERVELGDAMAANSLFANGGTALVIHAKADDQKTDPAGNAGDRIACGVITE